MSLLLHLKTCNATTDQSIWLHFAHRCSSNFSLWKVCLPHRAKTFSHWLNACCHCQILSSESRIWAPKLRVLGFFSGGWLKDVIYIIYIHISYICGVRFEGVTCHPEVGPWNAEIYAIISGSDAAIRSPSQNCDQNKPSRVYHISYIIFTPQTFSNLNQGDPEWSSHQKYY